MMKNNVADSWIIFFAKTAMRDLIWEGHESKLQMWMVWLIWRKTVKMSELQAWILVQFQAYFNFVNFQTTE